MRRWSGCSPLGGDCENSRVSAAARVGAGEERWGNAISDTDLRIEEMPNRNNWRREELLIALKLYCELPFGKMHSKNPEIQHYAKILGRTSSSLAMKLTNFASLDPQIRTTGRKGLNKASKADREIWEEMTTDWQRLEDETSKIESDFAAHDLAVQSEQMDRDYVGKTRTTQIQSRIGQDFFRKAVLSAYEYRCCISGLPFPSLLVASHILPWSEDKNNRLNPRNGLCLSSIHDKAFDQGLISVSEDFRLILSPEIKKMNAMPYIENTFCIYEGKQIHLPQKFNPDPAFLLYHREHLFKA